MNKEATATAASKVYGYVLANPGCTAREIRKGLGLGDKYSSVNSNLFGMVKRNALIAVNADGGRNTRYYKGAAPVVLRQAHGITNSSIQSEAALVKAKAELVRDIRLLMAQLESMTA